MPALAKLDHINHSQYEFVHATFLPESVAVSGRRRLQQRIIQIYLGVLLLRSQEDFILCKYILQVIRCILLSC